MNTDAPSERPRCSRPPHSWLEWVFPRVVRRAFGAVGLLGISLVLLAMHGNVEDDPDTSLHIPDATAALMDARLPMEVNERVDRWVRRFLTTERVTMEQYLVREGLYGAMIREKLRARQMPEELLYLAMIESGFSAAATSPVHASGVWQFMGPTARAYGLAVNSWVDERRDPVRATDAALDYLEELYAQFGSWYLAAAAYNSGPARVARALSRFDRVRGGDEELYWKISEHLPRETREYVPKILAATLIGQQAEHFGFEVERSLPYLFDRVMVPPGTPLSRVAGALDVSPSLMRELNPHLVRGVTPPGSGYLVRVPLGESHRVVAMLDSTGRVRAADD